MPKESFHITFNDIIYPVKLNDIFNPILKSINGTFSSGQLTGIIGRSGAGKTTLLNILAGQISTNLEGEILKNETRMDYKEFVEISSYLPQDVLLEPYLTVQEYMMFNASLILGLNTSHPIKEKIVLNILKALKLNHLINVRTDYLSGGERKRLSIAIELLKDPQVILLDEPTSGLDNVAASECINVLKNLASRGKIVICSIHQPSDNIFRMFDHVYFINDGNCIYDGGVQNLVPFLEKCGIACPKTYNPADYMLELDDAAYGKLKNKTLSLWNEKRSIFKINQIPPNKQEETSLYRRNPTGLFDQTIVLLRKNFIQLKRKKVAMAINVLHHIICGLAIGFLGRNYGTDAKRTINIYKLTLAIVSYIHLTYSLIPAISTSMTTKITKRDIRNGWYSLFPYLIADILIVLPATIILITTFAMIVYGLIFAEIDVTRCSLLSLNLILTSVCSHVFGLCFGIIFNTKNSAIMGPSSGAVGVLLSMSGLGGGAINPLLKFLRQISFPRYCIVGVSLAFYGGRQKLECDDVFCPHTSVQQFFKNVGFEDNLYFNQVIALSVITIVYTTICYLMLRLRFSTNATKLLKMFRLKYGL